MRAWSLALGSSQRLGLKHMPSDSWLTPPAQAQLLHKGWQEAAKSGGYSNCWAAKPN